MRNFKNNYNAIFHERIEEIRVSMHDNHPRFNELNTEIQIIKSKLLEIAPKEIEILIEDLEELERIYRVILGEKLYAEGLKDGSRITSIIKCGRE